MDNKKAKKALELEREKRKELMLDIPTELQGTIVARVCRDVDDDEANRTEFMKIRQEVMDLYEGKTEPKSDPFPNCSNTKSMIVTMTVELLHAKMYPSVYNEDMTYWVPTEKTDISSADNVGKFMKWDSRFNKFGMFVDDFTKNLCLEGTVVVKTRWEEEWKWVQRKIIKPSSMVKRMKNVILNMFGVPKITSVQEEDFEVIYDFKKFEKCTSEIVPLEDVGFPVYSIPGSDEDKLEHIWHRTKPFLPELKEKQASGWLVNVDRLDELITEDVTRGTEKSKMDAEGVHKSNLDRDRKPLEVIEWYGKQYIDGKGLIECIFWVEKKNRIYLGGMPLINISRINRRPFTISQLIKRTNRMYGKGIGDLIKDLQKLVDSIFNQHLDAGTFAIIPPGVYRAASGFTPENINIKPGLWIPVDDVNDVKYLQMPNNVLIGYQVIKMIMELIEKVSSAGAYQSGQESDINRSRSTARGTMAIIAQGEQRFMTLAKRIQFGLAKVLIQRFQLYQQNIPPGMEQRILGDSGEPVFPEGVAPEDIAGNYDVYLAIDSTGGSQVLERQTIATLYQAMIQNPLVMQNPAGFWELTADAFRASGKVDVERYIGTKPPSRFQPGQSVNEENTMILQGKNVSVKQTDNVLEHLVGHTMFASSPEGMSMPPEHKALLEGHILETQQQMLEQMRGSMTPQVEEMQAPPLGEWNAQPEGNIAGGGTGEAVEGYPPSEAEGNAPPQAVGMPPQG